MKAGDPGYDVLRRILAPNGHMETPATIGKPKPSAIKVVCLECAKKFTTRSLSPSCPKCGGVDIEVR